MLGAILGIVGGALEYILLKRLATTATSGKETDTTVLIFNIFAQILLPVCVLLVCALLLREQLFSCGVAMAAALLIASTVNFIIRMRRR